MTRKVLFEQHRLAFSTLFVLVCVLTLFTKMLIQGVHLNDLLTLPTGGKHWAILPVVNVDRLLVKVLVEASAEIADLFILIHVKRLFGPVVLVVVLGVALRILVVVV